MKWVYYSLLFYTFYIQIKNNNNNNKKPQSPFRPSVYYIYFFFFVPYRSDITPAAPVWRKARKTHKSMLRFFFFVFTPFFCETVFDDINDPHSALLSRLSYLLYNPKSWLCSGPAPPKIHFSTSPRSPCVPHYHHCNNYKCITSILIVWRELVQIWLLS